MEDPSTSLVIPTEIAMVFRRATVEELVNRRLPNIAIPLLGNLISPTIIPINRHTWPHIFHPVLPIMIMAILVRYTNASLLRLMLFPVAVLTTFRAAFVYLWTNPDYIAFNALKGYVCAVMIAKAVDYAFYADGIQRCQGAIKEVIETAKEYELGPEGVTAGSTEFVPSPQRWKYFHSFLSPISEALALVCSLRGIGYDHGEGVSIPPESRPLEKWAFIRATIRRCLVCFILADLIDTTWKLASPFNSTEGGSIFIQAISWKYRYLLSTLYHASTGLMIIYVFEALYYLTVIPAIMIFDQAPTDWPEVFYNPFISDSLHEFWAVRWHQLLRRVFFVFGGLPGYWLWGRLGLSKGKGLLIGTFIASGLFHELPLYAIGRGFEYRLPLFFVLQAFFMLGERKWKRITGHPVGGWCGRLWVMFAILVVGQNTFTSPIHERGIGGAIIIPPFISPTRRIFIPIMTRTIEYLSDGLLGTYSISSLGGIFIWQ